MLASRRSSPLNPRAGCVVPGPGGTICSRGTGRRRRASRRAETASRAREHEGARRTDDPCRTLDRRDAVVAAGPGVSVRPRGGPSVGHRHVHGVAREDGPRGCCEGHTPGTIAPHGLRSSEPGRLHRQQVGHTLAVKRTWDLTGWHSPRQQ